MLHACLQDVAYHGDRGGRVFLGPQRFDNMAALVQVFGVEQGDKLWVCAVVVQHKVHHLLQCQQRLAHIERQLSLSVIHALVNGFQHFDKQAFLAAEVVVNHPVVRLGQA